MARNPPARTGLTGGASDKEAEERRVTGHPVRRHPPAVGTGPRAPVAWEPRRVEAARRGLRTVSVLTAPEGRRRASGSGTRRAGTRHLEAGVFHLCRRLGYGERPLPRAAGRADWRYYAGGRECAGEAGGGGATIGRGTGTGPVT